MKFLISAFSVHPTKASEPAVARNWIRYLAEKGHDVTVVTRSIYRDIVETNKHLFGPVEQVTFIYFDLRGHRLLCRIPGYYFYCYLWQYAAACRARRILRGRHFDLVHHLTYGSVRFPTFMWMLDAPLVIGPIGGGETYPRALRKGLPIKPRLAEVVRQMSRPAIKWDPFIKRQFRQAAAIRLRTRDNIDLVGRSDRHKVSIGPEIALDPSFEEPVYPNPRAGQLRFIFVGRLLHWKGVHFAIRAFAQCHAEFPECRLAIVGAGTQADRMKALAASLGCDGGIDWVGFVTPDEVRQQFLDSDVLLFPSLHDAGAGVLIEAAGNGRPSLVLDLGASNEKIDDSRGWKLATAGLSAEEVIARLANTMKQLAREPYQIIEKARAAFAWSQTQTWPIIIEAAYAEMGTRLDSVRSGSSVNRPP